WSLCSSTPAAQSVSAGLTGATRRPAPSAARARAPPRPAASRAGGPAGPRAPGPRARAAGRGGGAGPAPPAAPRPAPRSPAPAPPGTWRRPPAAARRPPRKDHPMSDTWRGEMLRSPELVEAFAGQLRRVLDDLERLVDHVRRDAEPMWRENMPAEYSAI